ncbi:ExbD/TolR family protein [Desulfobulbus oligotrophicus]|jgi:biopolymer transport protein ExbD|uniref:Biopolymer transporter ExbD n=1 Tax=Desulfobulbus oligotrophicus TaxID=1909699 RepID=A0A7T6AQW3_9BACT|nr:biopolymer transporter ExbD [Desulfobulbus oligotrophicus]MDY0389478.1 biopolymer transporter ExbD [Desulfobulbus oligotrophicus]QQG65883.1 biopolymer transporter ExbD [Desulfobulbus oligotrophicus]
MDEREFDYLNVIPLVDVMLVLLTIVLTTSTFIATGGIKVDLPKAEAVQDASLQQPLTIAITKEGTVWVENSETPLPELATALAEVSRDTPITIRADRDIALQLFVDLYEAVKQLEFTTLSLQTEQQP